MPDLNDLSAALKMVSGLSSTARPGMLWPGFRPAGIPLVVWDGTQTTLFQSAAAPGSDWQAAPQGWTLPLRHPALVANTAVTLEGGIEAAALLLEGPHAMTTPELAALIVHEAFHVYQSTTHRPERWQANELAVFGYPLTAPVLAARRLETLALNAALDDAQGWQGHAAEALHWRTRRFTQLNAAQIELERGLERLEGLAQFVEWKVSGAIPRLPLPDFAPEAVRQRCYGTGAALALLLERSGEWQAAFMDGDLSLDELLSERLAGWSPEPLNPELVAAAQTGAALDAEQVHSARGRAMQDVLTRPGPRLSLESASPIWPQGFDPLNISDLGGGHVLHRRYLKFGNAQVSGETLGQAVLTRAAGEHPLEHGFSVVLLTGLTLPRLNDARLQSEAGAIRFEAQGLQLQISGTAEVQARPDGWTIRLP